MSDDLIIEGHRFTSRFILGSDKFSLDITRAVIQNGGVEMATRVLDKTHSHFENSILLFTPLYVSNYCSNECVYCRFNHRNRI